MKTGATDGGRYNVMGGGRPVVALCLPTRYLHANSGMISKADYEESSRSLIRGFLTTLTAEKVNAFSPVPSGGLMLNERQLKIVDLEQQPRTPGELAQTGDFRAGPSCVILTISTSPLTAKPAFLNCTVQAISWKSSSAAAFFSCCKSTITTIGCWRCYY